MNLEFLAGSNASLYTSLQSLGHDQDSLHFISKDYFILCDSLGLSSQQSAEMFIRIKNVHNAISQRRNCEVLLYENNRYTPTRLSVESRPSCKTIFFRIVSGQDVCAKKDILYNCETCNDDVNVKRCEAKNHFLEKHVS